MSSAATNGNGDLNDNNASSSSSTIPPPASETTPRAKKHSMRILGMPSLGISSSKPLIATPYAFSQASPFEYPFPSPTAASTPQIPMYIPSPAHSPFPFAPTLLSRVGTGGGVQSLGLGLPVWRRSASPPHPKFVPSRTEPPVPPTLIEKVQSMLKGKGEEKAMEGGGVHGDVGDEPERAREDAAEKSRPGSPDVT